MQHALALPATTLPKPQVERKRIELDIVIINDQNIEVISSASSTSFVGMRPIDLNVQALLAQYKRVVRLAKKMGAKITYQNRYKHFLTTNEALIESHLHQHAKLFEELKQGWLQKVKTGIFSGYCDDEELSRLKSIEYRMLPLQYTNTPLGKAQSIKNRLMSLEQRLLTAESNNEDLSFNKYAL